MFGAPFAIMSKKVMYRFRLKYACFMGSGEFSVHQISEIIFGELVARARVASLEQKLCKDTCSFVCSHS